MSYIWLEILFFENIMRVNFMSFSSVQIFVILLFLFNWDEDAITFSSIHVVERRTKNRFRHSCATLKRLVAQKKCLQLLIPKNFHLERLWLIACPQYRSTCPAFGSLIFPPRPFSPRHVHFKECIHTVLLVFCHLLHGFWLRLCRCTHTVYMYMYMYCMQV